MKDFSFVVVSKSSYAGKIDLLDVFILTVAQFLVIGFALSIKLEVVALLAT